jgi:hypothetical protein
MSDSDKKKRIVDISDNVIKANESYQAEYDSKPPSKKKSEDK